MFEVPGKDPGALGIKQEHEVFCMPSFTTEDEAAQNRAITQATLAGTPLASAFEGSHCVVRTWGVKWGPLGLTPVRPVAILTKSCTIPAGQALSLK